MGVRNGSANAVMWQTENLAHLPGEGDIPDMVDRSRHLVLASSSPRRRQLLAAAGYALEVIPADIDETPGPFEEPWSLVARLSREKASAISAAAGRIIVAADTAVVLDGVAYGKPVDDDDARAMLRRLSGCTHQVMTGWCVRRDDVFDGGVVATDVTFRRLDDDDINRWLATGEHRDKAGAYAIQGAAMVFVARVGGCLSNVVGLPVETVVAAVERAVAGQGQ
jgi:septum formation protein